MNTKSFKPFVLAAAMALSVVAQAVEIYVAVGDPNAGDEACDGRGSEEHPYRTLAAAMGHSGLASGSTVWVKPGVYNEESMNDDISPAKARVNVPAGVIVRATGADPAETVIEGAIDATDATNGYGADAMICARLHTGSVLRGFTLRKGRSYANDDTYGYGGGVKGGVLIDCVLTGNRGRRGGAVSGSTCIRCLFKADNGTSYTGSQGISGSYYNCIFFCKTGTYNLYQANRILNCTFYGNNEQAVNAMYDHVYNSAFIGPTINNSAGHNLYNCVIATATTPAVTEGAIQSDCWTASSTAGVPIDADCHPIGSGNPMYGRCTDYNSYLALFPAGFQSEAAYDFYGNPRKAAEAESFNCGAVEGLSVPKQLYVDQTTGDDDYTGSDLGTEGHPYRTIQPAIDSCVGLTGDPLDAVVNVGPGVYDQGGRTFSNSSVTLNRVAVPARVKLRSTQGADSTIIKGDTNIRCVYNLGEVRGFTLTGGKLKDVTATGDANQHGGGGYGNGGVYVDCVITNNTAHRGGGTYYGTYYRCIFRGNTISVLGTQNVGGSFYNCLIDAGTGGYALYTTGRMVNCTILGSGGTSDHNSNRATYNCVFRVMFTSVNAAATYDNCFFAYSDHSKDPAQEKCIGCRFYNSAGKVPTYTSGLPVDGSPVIDACTDYAAYVALFPEAYRDEAAYDLYGNPRIGADETTFDAGCVESGAAAEVALYVDSVNGSDVYDGDDLGSAAHPYRTLYAVMERANAMVTEDARYEGRLTVYALPGEYTEGHIGDENTRTWTRCRVPNGVKLVSTEGAARTIIRGARAPAEKLISHNNAQTYGVGSNATRAVSLQANAVVKGFTIADGRCYTDCIGSTQYDSGANVKAEGTAFIVDCVITNGVAERGGGGAGGNYVRCRFVRNRCTSISSCLYGSGNAYDCIFEKSYGYCWYNTGAGITVNCTFTSDNDSKSVRDQGNVMHHYNCLDLRGPNDNNHYHNSIVMYQSQGSLPGTYDGTTIINDVSEVKLKSAAKGLPKKLSTTTDTGDGNAYMTNYPAAYLADRLDVLGRPRVTGSSIDIGAVEYRPQPAQLLIR